MPWPNDDRVYTSKMSSLAHPFARIYDIPKVEINGVPVPRETIELVKRDPLHDDIQNPADGVTYEELVERLNQIEQYLQQVPAFRKW